MQDKILFSIIIPTYNRASFIKKTIFSALAQTCDNYEIIVVDDGSTDNTEEIVKNINNTKIQYHKILNSERGSARNFGASVSKGKYLNFFDSDDILFPNHLHEADKLVTKNNNPEFIHLAYNVIDDKGKELSQTNNFNGDVRLRLIKEGNLLSCNGVFLREDIVKTNPFDEDRRLSGSEDYDLWLRLSCKYKIYYSNTITSSIVNHDNRSVLQMNKEKLIERFIILVENTLKNKEFVAKYGKYKNLFIANGYSYISLHIALGVENKNVALKYLRKALLKNPQIIFSKRFLAIIKHLIFR